MLRSLANHVLVIAACSAAPIATGCRTSHPESLAKATDPIQRVALKLESTLVPSNERDWSPDLAVLPHAEFDGSRVTVHNIRNCVYLSDEDYVVNHYDKPFALSDVRSVDFIVVPFNEAPSLAHTMVSFGLDNDEFLVASVEARLEKGERYSPVLGALQQFELMYVLADERDVILRRTMHRDADVYVYRTLATPAQARALLVDMLRRVNQLADQPEFYDTLTNNCTTNLLTHLQQLQPGRLPPDPRLMLPGYADVIAYEAGLLDTRLSFEETKRRARVTARANASVAAADFSVAIRR